MLIHQYITAAVNLIGEIKYPAGVTKIKIQQTFIAYF